MAPSASSEAAPVGGRGRLVLFACGFRPFFLLAGLQGALVLPLWLAAHAGDLGLPSAFAPGLWHSHEMFYGFGVAVLAGFLLTAVPSWTGARPRSGWPLAGLAGLWLAGRLLFGLSALISPLLVALVDLAFVPALAAMVVPSLLPATAKRQRPFLVLLALLFCGNLLVHLGRFGLDWADPRTGVFLALDVFVMLLTIMGGRIVPSFTTNALRKAGLQGDLSQRLLVERLTIGLTALVIPLEFLLGANPLTGAAALAAAAAHLVRLGGWRSSGTLGEPILWVLHLGYLWLPFGLALRGLAMISDVVPPAAGIHALTIGAVGTMTLAVMSRAGLGHTGRPLKASRLTVAAYALVTLAALFRVLGTAFLPVPAYRLTLDLSGACWTLAFLLFTAAYGPILLRPRADGRPG